MKKVSIFFILLTITLITIDKSEFKDFFAMFVIFGVSYLFGFCIIKKIYQYNQRKRLENEIAEIFNNDFNLRVKRELAILKLKNEFRKISSSKLCTDKSNQEIEY